MSREDRSIEKLCYTSGSQFSLVSVDTIVVWRREDQRTSFRSEHVTKINWGELINAFSCTLNLPFA